MQRKWSSPHTTPSRVHWGFTCFKPRVWRGETSPPVQSHNKNSSGQIMVKTINQSEVWELLNNQIKQEAAEFWLSSADYWSIRNFSVSGQFVWNVVCLFNDWIRTFKELYIFFGHSCFDQSYFLCKFQIQGAIAGANSISIISISVPPWWNYCTDLLF